MNMILLREGYPTAIIHKRHRLAYVGALETAQLGGPKEPFFKIIAKAVDQSLDIYLRAATGKDSKAPSGHRLLKIGELAKRVGESNSTIRHWTKAGLLEVAEITRAGYQLYSQEMVEQVARIHGLKKKRLTLEEIKKSLQG